MMATSYVKLPGGGTAIVKHAGARRHNCFACHLAAGFQCDWIIGPRDVPHPKRCDRHICPDHATEVGPNKHVCPEHLEAYEKWKAEHEVAG